MKKLAILLVVGIFSVFIVACGTGETSEDRGTGSVPVDHSDEDLDESNSDDSENSDEQGEERELEFSDFVYKVSADVKEESVVVTMSLTNDSDQTRQLEFSSGQKFDVIIKDSAGNLLYHYAEGMMFTMALVMQDMGPGETISYEDIWESEDIKSYDELSIEATIVAYAADGKEIDNEPFKQTITVSVD